MYWYNDLWLIVLGIMGASNLIISRIPSVKEYVAKLAPYQGWMGVVSAIYGIWELISSFSWISTPGWKISGLLLMGGGIIQILLGLLLGVGVAKTFIKQPQAVAKMDMAVTKLAPFQGIFGLIAIGVGIAGLVIPFPS